jgi:hypothetical protein
MSPECVVVCEQGHREAGYTERKPGRRVPVILKQLGEGKVRTLSRVALHGEPDLSYLRMLDRGRDRKGRPNFYNLHFTPRIPSIFANAKSRQIV